MKKSNKAIVAALSVAMITVSSFSAFAAPGAGMGGNGGSMPSFSSTQSMSKPANDIGRKSDAEAMAEGTVPKDVPQNAPAQQMPEGEPSQSQDGQPKDNKNAEAGFNSTAIQQAVDALEDAAVKTAVQEKLDAYTAALDAEKTYLDSLTENTEIDSTYSENVKTAKEALEAALEDAGVETDEFFKNPGNLGDAKPEDAKADSTNTPDGTMEPDGTHVPDGTHIPDGTHVPGSESTES